MTWTKLLASRDVQRHRTSKKELDDIRALIARDLADAGVTAVSADRRFATAYNAALLAAHMVIACAGYRVTAKTGHHKVAFDAIGLSANASKYADYFERCRRKRNVIDYTCPSRIRGQAATGSWTRSLQWETRRTWFRSAGTTVFSPAKVSGVWPSNDAWPRAAL